MGDLAAALSAQAITADLPTRFVGQRAYYTEQLASTNDKAKELADAGEPEGTLVISEAQTGGRGRLGRTWKAPARSSILMSLILRPRLEPRRLAQVTMAVALGAQEAVRAETGLDARLKWPNDLVVHDRKCAGILAEANIAGERVEYVVVGLGLNVNFTAASVPDLPSNATTLSDELGRPLPRLPLIRAVLVAIDNYYARLGSGATLRSEWAANLATLGRMVQAHTPSGVETGLAMDVDDDGALLLRRADGTIARLIAGDVTLASE